MSYDAKCFELAEDFIDDTPAIVKTPGMVSALAQEIQDTIEEFLGEQSREASPK